MAKAFQIEIGDLGSGFVSIFIGPESDHWLPLSLTDYLTPCCLVDLTDVTLACEDANSKLVEVFTVADIDAEKRVDSSLVQICC